MTSSHPSLNSDSSNINAVSIYSSSINSTIALQESRIYASLIDTGAAYKTMNSLFSIPKVSAIIFKL